MILRTTAAALSTATLLLLSGCGSDDAPAQDSSADASTAPGRGPGAFDQSQLEEIQACLEAAGLEDAFPTDRPSGMPSGMPSRMPSDFDPSNPPSGFPTDGTPPGGGGGFAALNDPEVQHALEACGIELPQGPGGAPS